MIAGIGFNSGGAHKTGTKAYSDWRSMLYRCYRNQEKCYEGVTVEEHWHDYQNFADWHKDNYIKGNQLDKDLLVKGSKIYSRTTCSYVTPKQNAQTSRVGRVTFIVVDPQGTTHEVINQADFAQKHKLCKANLNAVLNRRRLSHKGWRLA